MKIFCCCPKRKEPNQTQATSNEIKETNKLTSERTESDDEKIKAARSIFGKLLIQSGINCLVIFATLLFKPDKVPSSFDRVAFYLTYVLLFIFYIPVWLNRCQVCCPWGGEVKKQRSTKLFMCFIILDALQKCLFVSVIHHSADSSNNSTTGMNITNTTITDSNTTTTIVPTTIVATTTIIDNGKTNNNTKDELDGFPPGWCTFQLRFYFLLEYVCLFLSQLFALILCCCKVDITKNIFGCYSATFGFIVIVANLVGVKGMGSVNFTGKIAHPYGGLVTLITMVFLYAAVIVRKMKSSLKTISKKGERTNTTFEALLIAMDVATIFFIIDFVLIFLLVGGFAVILVKTMAV